MRILFENKAELSSTIVTGTNESLNYPATNLIYPILSKRFQSTTTTSIISVVFDVERVLNCFFYGHHNITSLNFKMKNALNVTLFNLTLPTIEDIGVLYFDDIIYNVKLVEITITGPDPVYLGGVGVGEYYKTPDILADFEEPLVDNSTVISSSFGQTVRNKVPTYRQRNYQIRDLVKSVGQEIKENYKTIGIGKNVYIDLFSGNRSFDPPMFGEFTDPVVLTKNGRRYRVNIDLKESR